MHLGIPALRAFYHDNSDEPSLVLATIVDTEGSTYRKPGAMMLIAADGRFEGMISGGCLEGDLLHHAEAVFADGETRFVTYDMHAGDDLVWNLGLGCDGVIHLMLQRLDKADGFGFLSQLDAAHEAGLDYKLTLQTKQTGSDQPGDWSGETVMSSHEHSGQNERWRFRRDEARGCMQVYMPVPVRVLVCGAGPDALPLAQQLCALDWQVVVADHRSAFARSERFPDNCDVICTRPEKLNDLLSPATLDAAIIMSHHLENDAAYLRSLSEALPGYVGLLGPRKRRQRLCEMAEVDVSQTRGPAGLDIAAELPAAIALSIVAEIHAVLNQRDGRSLTGTS